MIRIAAVGDVHLDGEARGRLRPALEHVGDHADALLLAGDLTRHGTVEEAAAVRDEFSDLPVPVIAVLGNHDYHGDAAEEVTALLTEGGIIVLEGDGVVVETSGGTLGVAGVKGFGGGFGRGTLEPWGEAGVKQFVHAAVEEGLKLERALARLHCPQRVALLHYAPIRETVLGEPEEIFAFLGCGRLEEPLNRYGVSAIFHGHAHRGAHTGKTAAGIPVYNVALPVMRQLDANALPIKIIELPVAPCAPPEPAAAVPELARA